MKPSIFGENELRAYAYKLLAAREHGEKELRTKLLRKIQERENARRRNIKKYRDGVMAGTLFPDGSPTAPRRSSRKRRKGADSPIDPLFDSDPTRGFLSDDPFMAGEIQDELAGDDSFASSSPSRLDSEDEETLNQNEIMLFGEPFEDPEGVVDSLIEELKAANHLSDERFVETYVWSMKDQYGARKLKDNLLKKGVDREEIDKHIDFKDEHKRAADLLHRRFANREPDNKEEQKYLRFLFSRGFDTDTCYKAVEYYKSEEWLIDNDGEDGGSPYNL